MNKTICGADKLREIRPNFHFEVFWALRAVEDGTPISLMISTGSGDRWIDLSPEYVYTESTETGSDEEVYIHGKILPENTDIDIHLDWIKEVDPLQGKVACDVTRDVFTDDAGQPFLCTVVTCSWCGYQVEHPDTGDGAIRQCVNQLARECEITHSAGKSSYQYYAATTEENE